MADVEKALSLLAEMEQRPTLFDLPYLVKAVRGVLEQHDTERREGDRIWCRECGIPAPCPTVRAVCEALEVGE